MVNDPFDDLAWDRDKHADFELRLLLDKMPPYLKDRLRHWVNLRIDEKRHIADHEEKV